MPTWEKILIGVLVVLLVLFLRPGLRAAMRQSREAEHKDWTGALVPILLVALFVVLLIGLAR